MQDRKEKEEGGKKTKSEVSRNSNKCWEKKGTKLLYKVSEEKEKKYSLEFEEWTVHNL